MTDVEHARPAPATAEIARFYTRSRKFPRMVGRLPEGTRIWGGPYTFTQLGLGLAATIAALLTREVWSSGSVLLDLAVVLGVGWGTAYLGRYIPMTSLNPIVVLGTALGAFSAPSGGSYRGRPVTPSRPHRVRGRVLVDLGGARTASGPLRRVAAPAAEPIVERVDDARPDPTAEPPAAPAPTAPDAAARPRGRRDRSRANRARRRAPLDAARRTDPVPLDAARRTDPVPLDAGLRADPVPPPAAAPRRAPAHVPDGRPVTGLQRLLAQTGAAADDPLADAPGR